jgi:hypothetical protein
MRRRIDINSKTRQTTIEGIETMMRVTMVDLPVHERDGLRSERHRETAVYVGGIRAFDVSVYIDGEHIVTIPPGP